MFFCVEWDESAEDWNETTRLLSFSTSLGECAGMLVASDRGGRVAIVFEPICYGLASFSSDASYVQALDYSGLGLLSEWLEEVEAILPDTPSLVTLTASAVPSALLAGEEEVKTFIAGLGFEVTLSGRTLRLSKRTSPRGAVQEFRMLGFALDHEGRRHVGDEIRQTMNEICLARFGRSSAFSRLTLLISETQGRSALDGLLGRERRPKLTRAEPVEMPGASRLLSGFTVEAGKKIPVMPSQVEPVIEGLSRFGVDPRWLIFLPPGMASVQSSHGDYLEHPADAFSYYRDAGVSKVVVEYKHMGSRAVVIVCGGPDVAAKRFGFTSGDHNPGCVFTRNGRPFFSDPKEEKGFLLRLRETLVKQNFWNRWQTDWVLLDGEILPWSLKAERLLEEKHGDILAAGLASLRESASAFGSGVGTENIVTTVNERLACFEKYGRLYERYSSERGKPVQFAPFQLLATEGRTYFDKNHLWQMQVLGGIARRSGGVLRETPFQSVNVDESAACERAIEWWKEITEQFEEGFVIKPLPLLARERRGGMAQPGVKCRGREHLRLVYGPEYDRKEFLEALRERAAFVHRRKKHRRIVQQFTLSLEAVKRFVALEPLERVQECVVAIAALERRPE